MLLRIFIYAVAVYRFTLMLYEEDGPFDVFIWLRIKSGQRHNIQTVVNESGVTEARAEMVADTFFAKLLDCPYCISMWLSIFAAIGVKTKWFDWLAIPGCIAGIVHFALKKLDY
jgi:hypothetical protein